MKKGYPNIVTGYPFYDCSYSFCLSYIPFIKCKLPYATAGSAMKGFSVDMYESEIPS